MGRDVDRWLRRGIEMPVPNRRGIWLDPEPVLVPDSLSSAVGGHPIVARILAQRGMGDLTSAPKARRVETSNVVAVWPSTSKSPQTAIRSPRVMA